MDIFDIITLFGGVGLFLYGMHLMGESLKNLAGSSLENILARLTTSRMEIVGRIKGFALGTVVTAIIQSSAATTIMLIGFVNAGIMNLSQTTAVVFGANVGSTATAQILRLADIGGENVFLKLLKPSSFAPILIGIGSFILLFAKKKRLKDIAGILIGLGVLFFGMTTMEHAFEPLQESESFKALFISFTNPLIGFGIGLVLTALIQSSSASVGILQVLSTTGAVTYASAIPVIIGMNVGKCSTILLGSIGANKKAKRVSIIYLVFNLFGAAALMTLIYGVNAIAQFEFWADRVNHGDIANIHLLFNLLTAAALLPLTRQVADLTGRIMNDVDEENGSSKVLDTLDIRLLNTPVTAIAQSRIVMCHMIDNIMENYYLSTGMFYNYSEEDMAKVENNEKFIDKCETTLNEFLLKVTSQNMLSRDLRKQASELLNSISDLERIGDHCAAMAHFSASMKEAKLSFSEKGKAELQIIITAVEKILDLSFTAFKKDDSSATIRIEILDDMINELKETIKEHHVNRLQTGECSVEVGFFLVDTLTSLERIGGHCVNVAHHVTKRFAAPQAFDEMHGHAYNANLKNTEEYQALYMYYEQAYLKPIGKYNAHPIAENEAPAEAVVSEALVTETDVPETHEKAKKKKRPKKK